MLASTGPTAAAAAAIFGGARVGGRALRRPVRHGLCVLAVLAVCAVGLEVTLMDMSGTPMVEGGGTVADADTPIGPQRDVRHIPGSSNLLSVGALAMQAGCFAPPNLGGFLKDLFGWR